MDKESLLNTLTKATANATDVYFELYTNYLENGDAPEDALEIILEYPMEIGDTKDDNPHSIELQTESKINLIFEEIICGTANRIAEMNLEKKAFYQKLYSTIFDSTSDLYPQHKEEKVIALKILSEKALAVPYFQITETDKVTKEEFENAIENLRPNIQEAFCMLQRPFNSTTELVAQILRIAKRISNNKELLIFWTLLFNKLRKHEDRIGG